MQEAVWLLIKKDDYLSFLSFFLKSVQKVDTRLESDDATRNKILSFDWKNKSMWFFSKYLFSCHAILHDPEQ